jgi:hypothetical protein
MRGEVELPQFALKKDAGDVSAKLAEMGIRDFHAAVRYV